MRELKTFPAADGHIESVLIGFRKVKISFQTWDGKKLVLIYDDVNCLKEYSSVFWDISEYTETETENEYVQYSFFDINDELLLEILAKSLKVYEVGENADINDAVFDIGYDYIGG